LIPAFFARERPAEALDINSSDSIATQAPDTVTPQSQNFYQRVLRPLVLNRRFYPVALMAFTTTAVYEAIGSWSMHFFEHVCQCNRVTAGYYTASLFATQIPSYVLGGWLLDHLPKRFRTIVPVVFLGACAALCAVFATLVQLGLTSAAASLAMFLLINFALSAPNSFVDGVYVVEMCGAGGAAFGAGTVGTLGYLGAMTIQFIFGSAAKTTQGWTKILWTLFGYILIALGGAIVYMWIDIRERRSASLISKAGVENSKSQA